MEQMTMAQQSNDILVIQVGTAEAKVYKDIGDEECLRIIANSSPAMAESLRATNTRLAAVRNEVLENPDKVVDYYQLQAAQAQVDDQVNAEMQNLQDVEQGRRIDEYHRYTTIGSSLLYADAGFGGASKFFSVTWPNMKWWPYRFNDRASSAKAWGGNILFQHTWYHGRKLYLIGLPFVQFDDLSVFGFNDMASSFASLP
jgi:hypothetical protein